MGTSTRRNLCLQIFVKLDNIYIGLDNIVRKVSCFISRQNVSI